MEERRPAEYYLSLVCMHIACTAYGRGYVHVGCRGEGVGMGWSKEGPGSEECAETYS
jgi:hypothetical protein